MLTRKDPNEVERNSGELNTIIGRGSVIEGTLTVQSSLRVKTSRLVIDEGAIFEGKCTMGEDGKSPLITDNAANRNVSGRPLGMGQEVTNR